MQDIKENALEKIKSLQKIDPDFVLSWLGGLTDLEQKIVATLYQLNKAVTIKDIMTTLVLRTLFANLMNVKNSSEYVFPFKSYFFLEPKIISALKEISTPQAQFIKLKKEFKFPSFRRIDKSNQDLISMGIVLAREEKMKNEKIKGLYYLNPIIRTQLNLLKKS